MVKHSNSKIWFIRHAESESNAGMRSSITAKIPLSIKGFEQAKNLVKKFANPPELIVTSSYIRTQQTAAPLIKKYPDVIKEEWEIHEFTYLSPIRCQNTTQNERLPMAKEYWMKCDPHYCDGGGSESFIEFIGRVQRTIDKLRKRDERFISLFSHEQFIAAVLWINTVKISSITSKEMKEYRIFLDNNRIANCDIKDINLVLCVK